MEEKNGFDITKLHCGAVVKGLLERANPDDAVFCFFEPFFFSLQSLFFNAIFPFGMFSFINSYSVSANPADHALGSLYIFSISPQFYFAKGISRALDQHTGQA